VSCAIRESKPFPVDDWPETKLRGREVVWDFLLASEEPWEPGPYEATEITAGSEVVAVRLQRELRGRASGAEVDYDYWVVFAFREGRIIRIEWFHAQDDRPRDPGDHGRPSRSGELH
jgi:ketosteroid isomerase-like protein